MSTQNQILVLQNPHLSQINLTPLWNILKLPEHAQAGNSTLRRILINSLEIPDAAIRWLGARQIDYAILPNLPFNHLGLIVSDMDSTLITIECIDEIADSLNLKKQVAAITERAMQGELDFTSSLLKRVALLKGLPETELETVYQKKVRLSQGGNSLITQAKNQGIKFMLVSGGFTFFTERLKERLELDFAFANQLEIINGKLTGKIIGNIIDPESKAHLLKEYQQKLNLDSSQVLAIGDGANDIPMLQAAGISVAYHAKEKVKQNALICINFNGLDSIRNYFC